MTKATDSPSHSVKVEGKVEGGRLDESGRFGGVKGLLLRSMTQNSTGYALESAAIPPLI